MAKTNWAVEYDRDGVEAWEDSLTREEAFKRYEAAKLNPAVFSATVRVFHASNGSRMHTSFERNGSHIVERNHGPKR